MFSLNQKIIILVILLLAVSFCFAAAGKNIDNDFTFDLFRKTAEANSGNFGFAPLNLRLSLSLAANGAEGDTRSEMLKVLDYDETSLQDINEENRKTLKKITTGIKNIDLDLSRSLWIDHELTVRDEFKKISVGSYKTDLRSIDLADPLAPDQMNSWIFQKTGGKIFSMVDGISRDIIMYMLSSFYFKGSWGVQFKPENSRKMEFTNRKGKKSELVFMKTKSEEISFLERKGFTAVGLPYGKGEISMFLFLPNQDSHVDILIKSMNSTSWKKWMEEFRKQEVVVVLPKVDLSSDLSFKKILKDLGMKDAFGKGGDFGALCEGGAFISEVKQKTFLTINEEGTEAAAVDKVVFKKGGCPHVYFNRPFIYALMDNRTQTILLMGVYQK